LVFRRVLYFKEIYTVFFEVLAAFGVVLCFDVRVSI